MGAGEGVVHKKWGWGVEKSCGDRGGGGVPLEKSSSSSNILLIKRPLSCPGTVPEINFD